MKKTFLILLTTLLLEQAFSQTEKFDITTYTPPKDWKKQTKPGLIIFTDVNESKDVYCMLAIYASTPSTGNPEQDFTNEWNDRAIKLFGAAAAPKTETQTTADGWKVIAGAAPIVQDGATSYLVLTVFIGYGKTMSVLANLNDEAYLAQIDALLESMKLDKTSTASTTMKNNTIMQTTGTTGKFGTMMYKVPDGWREQQFSDGVVFKPLDLPADEHLAMQIMQPLDFAGSLEQALAQSYNEAATMYNSTKMHYAGGAEYQNTEARRSFNGWEYIQGNGGVQVENGTPYKTELGLDLFVIKVNNRFERVAVLKSRKNCNLSRYYSTDRLKYNNAINNFLFSLQFTDGTEPILKPGNTKGSGIIGVWQGISLSVGGVTTAEPLGVRYKVFTPIFLSNGQAYFGPKFPTQGLDGLDSRIPAELHRRDWGTYTFSNGRGILKMPYGDIPLRMENNKLVITPNKTDHAFFQMNSVDGARFNGTYTLSEVNGKTPTITFAPDGRFADEGAIKVLYHEYIDCINPALTPGSGTYEVKNYSVLFNYTDGRKVKIAFLGTDYTKSNPSPAKLVMSYNEDELRRL